jgi:hypothetical protein
MASATFMATAVSVATGSTPAPAGDPASAVGLLASLSENAWGVGNLFFGLWLIPMGWVALSSGRMPRVLGWLLVVGGIGYLLSGILKYGIEGAPGPLVEGLALVASVGEFWMIGYLLIMGIRPERPAAKEVRA